MSYKIKCNNNEELIEIQHLFFKLGYSWSFSGKEIVSFRPEHVYARDKHLTHGGNTTDFCEIINEEITLDQLKGMVILHNNDINDATHVALSTDKYVNINNIWYYFSNRYNHWSRSILKDSLLSKQLKPIKKQEEPVKEYLTKNSNGEYILVNHRLSEYDIEVPEGAEVCVYSGSVEFHFWKDNGLTCYDSGWLDCENYGRRTVANFMEHWKKSSKIVWTRNETQGYYTENIQLKGSTDTLTNNIDWKLSFIKKWMEGEKIQYIFGEEKGNTQWHNFTDKSINFIKRPDIKLRVAPKYVTINGVEFKSKEKLMKYVDNNFYILP